MPVELSRMMQLLIVPLVLNEALMPTWPLVRVRPSITKLTA
jgi:hypothetical protein